MPNNDSIMQAFFTQKPSDVKRWFTVEIYHASIGTLRYIRDFVAHDLQIETGAPRNSGETVEFLPLGVEWSIPEQTDDGVINIPVTFNSVGTDVRKKMKSLDEWDLFDGIEIIPRMYISTSSDPRLFYYLNVTNVNIVGVNVNISASDENPTTKRTARHYDFIDFPGLAEV